MKRFAAGDYEIDDGGVLIEGLSWAAYRRVATFIKLPAAVESRYRMQLIQIAPDELARLVAPRFRTRRTKRS